MKINWQEYQDKEHVLAWFISGVITERQIKDKTFNNAAIDVEFTVNGETVDFLKCFELLQSQLNNIEKNGIETGRQQMLCSMESFIEQEEYKDEKQ